MKINDRVRIDDIRRTDLHMHTVYCDGKNTPEEMIQSAIQRHMTCIGFSGHSYVRFDPEAGMPKNREEDYCREIARLQSIYDGQIRIFCGLELDYHTLPGYAAPDFERELQRYKAQYDYLIGSVHYIPVPGESVAAAVDDTPEIFMGAVAQYYDGDYYRAAEAYYQLEADIVRRTDCDIIGHFDLIAKFNQKYRLFDEQHPRYVRAWQQALDALLPSGRIFEINTGGMSRGWRTVPYPAPEMQTYIRQKGGKMILSSDSHNAETIGCYYSQSTQLCHSTLSKSSVPGLRKF